MLTTHCKPALGLGSQMRNASVSALIYEFLYKIYWKMGLERSAGHNVHIPDENGVIHEAFSHDFTSCWEWSSGLLKGVGLLKPLPAPASNRTQNNDRLAKILSPYYYPVMTLDECLQADFSPLETFDHYCYAMFTFYEFIPFGYVDLDDWSARFADAVATEDDIFVPDGTRKVEFSDERFKEKVMTQWHGLQERGFPRWSANEI